MIIKELKNSIKSNQWFIIGFFLFVLIFFILQNINNRFNMYDFEVYYMASKNLFNGEQVYFKSFGLNSGLYKYSPFALLLFAPFTLFSFTIAKIIYFYILATFIAISVIYINRFIQNLYYPNLIIKNNSLVIMLISLSFLQHIYYELHLGNINIILLLIALLALNYILQKKSIVAGILIALGILIKPHFLILIPLLIVRKKFKATITVFLSLLIGLLIPSIFFGFNKNNQLLQDWKSTMIMHNASPVQSQDTIYSWINKISNFSISPDYYSLTIIFTLVLLMSLILLLIIFHYKEEKMFENAYIKNFCFEYFLLVALIPTLTVTDTEHFMFSVPLLSILMHYLLSKSANKYEIIFIIIGFVLYGGNLRDVIGKDISLWMSHTGILGLGNLLIILLSLYVFSFKIKSTILIR